MALFDCSMGSIEEFLGRCSWYTSLDSDAMARVRADMTCSVHAAGSIIAPRARHLKHWVGIMEGLGVLGCDSRGGKPAFHLTMTERSWFGEGSLLKDEPLKFEAFAKVDCRVARLPRATFMWLLETSIAFNHAILQQINERCSQFLGMLTLDRTASVEERVANCMSALMNPVLYPGTGALLPLSQEEIGHLCGLSRQTVNRVLKDFEQAGLVRVTFKHVEVLDLARLLHFAAVGPPPPPPR